MTEAQFMNLKNAVGSTLIEWLKVQESDGVAANEALEGIIKVMMGYGAFYSSLAYDEDEFISLAVRAYELFSSEGETLQ